MTPVEATTTTTRGPAERYLELEEQNHEYRSLDADARRPILDLVHDVDAVVLAEQEFKDRERPKVVAGLSTQRGVDEAAREYVRPRREQILRALGAFEGVTERQQGDLAATKARLTRGELVRDATGGWSETKLEAKSHHSEVRQYLRTLSDEARRRHVVDALDRQNEDDLDLLAAISLAPLYLSGVNDMLNAHIAASRLARANWQEYEARINAKLGPRARMAFAFRRALGITS